MPLISPLYWGELKPHIFQTYNKEIFKKWKEKLVIQKLLLAKSDFRSKIFKKLMT